MNGWESARRENKRMEEEGRATRLGRAEKALDRIEKLALEWEKTPHDIPPNLVLDILHDWRPRQ